MSTKFKQNLDVTGNITLSGQVNAQGNVTLGDADSDSVTFSADVTSHIIPDLTATYDLGADGKAWRSVHAGNLIFEGSNVDGNETTFGVVNPTADRTINLPDSTGTVATEEWVNAQGFGAGAGGSINGLNDVDTATSAPTTGQVLKWDGNNWIPQNDTASSYTNASVDTHLNQSTATSNQVLSWSGSDYAWVANGQGSMSNVVEDTTPQLGGNLDINGKDIVSVSNIDIRLLPNGNGKVIFDGNGSTSGISVSDGLIEMRTGTGTVAQIDLYCEVNNAHKVTIKPPPHAEYSGNLTFQLPNSNGTNGQYLKTDGNGVTSWGTVSGGSTDLNSLSAGVINTQNDSIGFIDADDSNNSKKETIADFLTAIAGSGISVSSGQLTAGTANNPGGADTQVQFNDSSSFGGDSDFTYNKTTNTLTVVNLTATNITTTGSGSTTVTAGANIELNATNRVLITDTVFRLASMTTTQRNAVASPVNGDMIYNSTTNQIESYENNAWVATAGSSGGGGDITRVNITAGTGLTGTQDTTTGDHTQTLAVDVGTTANKIVQLDGTAKLPAVDGSQLTNISGSGIASVVADTTPQLGGDLDTNGKNFQYNFNVGANGTSAYTFADAGTVWFPTTAENPTLYLRRGEIYKFIMNASGHPFYINTTNSTGTSNAYSTGVTNNGAATGTITFKVPMSAPATLHYNCQYHSAMNGIINIV